jgi:hypothetical protein
VRTDSGNVTASIHSGHSGEQYSALTYSFFSKPKYRGSYPIGRLLGWFNFR